MAIPLTGGVNPTSIAPVMSDPMILDIFLRGSAIGTLALCAAVFMRNGGFQRKSMAVVLLCLSFGPYLIVSSPSIDLTDSPVRIVLVMIAGVIPVLLYWAVIELFQDDVFVRPWQILTAALIVGLAWLSQLQLQLGAVRGICVLIFFFHGLWIVVSGQAGDLIEARRRFRRWFLIWILSLGILITGFEITHLDKALPVWVFALQASAFFLSAGAFLLWSVRVVPDIWIPSTPKRDDQANPAQSALITRIEAAMSEGLWRIERLTVAQVAAHLGTQEHRIRSAINQGLGHRNFASFVNAFRIQEAQSMLSSPELAERSVLSIAYDVGFSSLGPFNRAFRAQTGMTPSEFRRAHLHETTKSRL